MVINSLCSETSPLSSAGVLCCS